MKEDVYLYNDECYNILGAIYEVHKHLGCGLIEKIYQEALEIELKSRGIPYEREKRIIVNYKGIQLKHDFYADFVCYGKIILELKAVDAITPQHESQIHNYLRLSGYRLGYLVNFNSNYIRPIRIIY